MPLLDERPRQSVANLIGRFERQGKRQASPGPPVVPRSSSVSSQIAGDAGKEDIKEKREWPPKPAASADIKQLVSTHSASPSPAMSNSPVVSPQPIPEPTPPVDIPTTPTPMSPEPTVSPPSKGKAVVVSSKSTPTVGARRAAVSAPKKHTSVTNSSSAKSLVGSPPKTSLQSSVSQPLRSQHTGHSVTSNPSTTRQVRPVPRTAPSTPSRPKSSASRNHPVPRPKTPSSGLFAPTAASLARSRNAPPPPPPPIKKMTLSSDAAERLSKPTAASLSKARAPVHIASGPAKVSKPTSAAVHGVSPRGPSKPKAGRPSLRTQEANNANTKEEVKTDHMPIPSQPPRDSDHLGADHTANGHEPGTAPVLDTGLPEVAADVVHDSTAVEETHSDSGVYPERHAEQHVTEDEVHVPEHVAEPPAEEIAHEQEQVHLGDQEDSVPEPAKSHASQVVDIEHSVKVEPAAAPGNDIEDIVNLLEGAPLAKSRPQSMASIPDELPDEY